MAVWLALSLFAALPHAQAAFPDTSDVQPTGYTGLPFKLSQTYPAAPPSAATYPWHGIDPTKDPWTYLQKVLDYAYVGNLAVDWRVEQKANPDWYHAPWLHAGNFGREFVHGLTRERPTKLTELDPQLKPLPDAKNKCVQNWAVSFYNPPGGYVIGQVWKNPTAPDPKQALFPADSVMVKLLFTEATDADVPYLANSVVWDANIHSRPATLPANRCPAARRGAGPLPRSLGKLRLLQIDVAVRDPQVNTTTGWVFGTFIYQASAAGGTAWERMVPVGIMWGNDPGITPVQVAAGQKLQETIINPAITPLGLELGWAGRLNGPVDDPKSACLSCHATAQAPRAAMTGPVRKCSATKIDWFQNIRAPTPFMSNRCGLPATAVSTDYSLQLATGIAFQRAASQPPSPVRRSGPFLRWARMPAEGEDTAVLVGLPVPETPRAGEPEDDEGLDFELVATLCLALALLFPIAAWLGRRPASVSSPP